MKQFVAIITVGVFAGFGLGSYAQERITPSTKLKDSPRLVRIKEALKLTAEQEKKIEEFIEACRTQRKTFIDQVRKLDEEMRALHQGGDADLVKADSLIDRMFNLRADHLKVLLKQRQDWRKIFTPEQLEIIRTDLRPSRGMPRMSGQPPMVPGKRMRRGPWMHPEIGQERRGFNPETDPDIAARPDPGMEDWMTPDLAPGWGDIVEPNLGSERGLGWELELIRMLDLDAHIPGPKEFGPPVAGPELSPERRGIMRRCHGGNFLWD